MAGVLNDDVSLFLWQAARRGFVWGDFDCLSWFGAWIAVRHGVNPALPLTTYHNRIGALRLVSQLGGMAGVVDAAVSPLGIERTGAPQRGDVAIVDTPVGEAGGIVLGASVACLNEGGIVVGSPPILTAWRI